MIPRKAVAIIRNVLKEMTSFSTKKAIAAVMNGIALSVKSVFATEVILRLWMKHILAIAKNIPAIIPGLPTAVNAPKDAKR